MSKLNLNTSERIGGFNFKLNEDNSFYECRGQVCYDDEHDEVPEQNLWDAANLLVGRLGDRGIKSCRDHSEKGWVEVHILPQ